MSNYYIGDHIKVSYRIKGKFVTKEEFHKHVSLHSESVTEKVNKTTIGFKKENDTNMNITLPNGLKLDGTVEQVTETAQKLGFSMEDLFSPREFYKSSTKGYIKITEMQSQHMMNAVNKLMVPWLKDLAKTSKTGREFIEGFQDKRGIENHSNLLAMLKELSGRHNS